jgi:hypothetical protein
MKRLFFYALSLSLASCASNDLGYVKCRGISLEGNVRMVSVVMIPKGDLPLYKDKDTVWVNLDTHKVDDTCTNAMAYLLELDNY